MDISEMLRRHVEATAQRDACAARAIELLAHGDEAAALDELEEAELWQLRLMALEPDSPISGWRP